MKIGAPGVIKSVAACRLNFALFFIFVGGQSVKGSGRGFDVCIASFSFDFSSPSFNATCSSFSRVALVSSRFSAAGGGSGCLAGRSRRCLRSPSYEIISTRIDRVAAEEERG